MRRVFSFDVDGVVAGGDYIPILDRTQQRYAEDQLVNSYAPTILNRIAYDHDVYFVSSRGYQDATSETRSWLWRHGFDLAFVAGVICNILPRKKVEFCRMLRATYHFDDDPRIIESMPDIGVLVKNHQQFPSATASRIVYSWNEIQQVCNLPKLGISLCPQQGSLFTT